MEINKKWATVFLLLGFFWWLWCKFKWLLFVAVVAYIAYLVCPPIWEWLNTFDYHWSWWYLIPIFIGCAVISDGMSNG